MSPVLKHIIKRVLQGLLGITLGCVMIFVIGYLCFLLPLNFFTSLGLTILIIFILGLAAFAYNEFHIEADKKQNETN